MVVDEALRLLVAIHAAAEGVLPGLVGKPRCLSQAEAVTGVFKGYEDRLRGLRFDDRLSNQERDLVSSISKSGQKALENLRDAAAAVSDADTLTALRRAYANGEAVERDMGQLAAALRMTDAFAKSVAARAGVATAADAPPTPTITPPATDAPSSHPAAVQPPGRTVVDVRDRDGASLRVAGGVKSLRLESLAGCAVATDGAAGSVTVRRSNGCVLWIAARKVRVVRCTACVLVLRAGSAPVIDGCSRLVFAPWTDDTAPAPREWEPVAGGPLATDADGDDHEGKNHWNEVRDASVKEGEAPNWRALRDGEPTEAWITSS